MLLLFFQECGYTLLAAEQCRSFDWGLTLTKSYCVVTLAHVLVDEQLA